MMLLPTSNPWAGTGVLLLHPLFVTIAFTFHCILSASKIYWSAFTNPLKVKLFYRGTFWSELNYFR